MTIADPRTDVMSIGKFVSQTFRLVSRQELSRSADGTTKGKDLGPAIWMGEWQTRANFFPDAVTFEAVINSLDGAIGRFHASDLRRRMPLEHSDGAFTDSGQIKEVYTPKRMSLKNLTPGMKISVGDYLSFVYGASNSVALHQVMETVSVYSSGETDLFEVRPPVKTGASVGTAVKLKNPYGVFRLEPGSVQYSMPSTILSSLSFRAFQVF